MITGTIVVHVLLLLIIIVVVIVVFVFSKNSFQIDIHIHVLVPIVGPDETRCRCCGGCGRRSPGGSGIPIELVQQGGG